MEAHQWRQIYRACHYLVLWLVLCWLTVAFHYRRCNLEYLVKRGPNRIPPPPNCVAASSTSTRRARIKASMVTTLKPSNVLRRYIFLSLASAIAPKSSFELLADVEKILQEGEKDKANRTKYVGLGHDRFSFASVIAVWRDSLGS
jgi:hypothetical protein